MRKNAGRYVAVYRNRENFDGGSDERLKRSRSRRESSVGKRRPSLSVCSVLSLRFAAFGQHCKIDVAYTYQSSSQTRSPWWDELKCTRV